MRVSRIQAEENRQKVINVASRLFREHGFDGIGLKDLMKGAGLTQGAFYKQFASKEDLTVQASRRALESVSRRWSDAAAQHPDDPLGAVIRFYLSADHREERMEGCPVVALGSDAARQGPDVKAAFEVGIEAYLDVIGGFIAETGSEESRRNAMAILATMIGAVILSRAVNDERLSTDLLQAAAESLLKGTTARGPQEDQIGVTP